MKFARRTSAGSSPASTRERVDRALHHLRRLGTAGAAQRRGRAGVRHDRVKPDLDPRDPVHAGRHQPRQRRQDRADAGVSAGVLQQPQVQRLEVPVAVAAEREPHSLAAAVAHRDHVLRARLGPAHRPVELARQPRHEHVLGQQPLAAEAAADVRRDHVHAIGLDLQRLRQRVSVLVWRLGGQPDPQPAVLPDRRGRAWLDRSDVDPLAVELALDDDVAAIEQVGAGLVGPSAIATLVPACSNSNVSFVSACALVGDRGQRLHLGPDSFGGVNARGARVGDDHRDDLPDEPRLAGGDRRPRHVRIDRGMHRWWRGQVDVGRGEHPRAVGQLGGVDLGDRGVGVLGAHERRPQCTLELQIVDVATVTGQKPRILAAAHALPDHRGATRAPCLRQAPRR